MSNKRLNTETIPDIVVEDELMRNNTYIHFKPRLR